MEIAFTQCIKTSAAQVRRLPVGDFIPLVKRGLQQPDFQVCEWLANDPVVRVYFDVDDKSPGRDEASLLHRSQAAVTAFFDDRPEFDFDLHVLAASSHGPHKLSFRFYAPLFAMRVSDIKARIIAKGLDEKSVGGVFDVAPYGKNQKIRCVGAIKSSEDRRRLVMASPGRLPEYILQNLSGSETRLKSMAPTPISVPSTSSPADTLTTTTTTVPASTLAVPRKRGRPRKEDTLPSDWRDILVNMGFNQPHSLSSFSDARGSGYSFTADNRRDCPCCAHPHDSNNWYTVKRNDGTYLVKSHSEKCKFRIVDVNRTAEQQLSADPVTIQDKLQGMEVEGIVAVNSAPGELHYHRFACRRRECLACADDHGASYDYDLQEIIKDGAAWKLSNTASTCRGTLFHSTAALPSYLTAVIREPTCTSLTQCFLAANSDRLWCEQTLQDVRMWQGKAWMRITPKEFGNLAGDWLVFLLGQTRQMDAFSESGKQLKEALNMCKAPAQQQALAQKILSTRSLACRGISFDDDQWLLGCEDCVIDLRTGVARAPRRQDMVSITTGYNFLDTDNDPAAIYELMEKVYPVEEERNFMQAFAGYCLTGSCSEKKMLCCTDRRGGSNGKTLFKSVLRQALGLDRYAKEGQKELLYQSNNIRDINAHDAGKLSYEFKRFVYFDEMTSKRSLDNATVKDYTSGDSHPTVRAMFGTTPRSMTWTAKLVMIFNQGECPKLRAEDDALMARLVVVQHRAKFCKDDSTYAQYTARGEQYVHMAGSEETISAALTPARALAWMLQGLERYRREGFRHLPESFGTWRQELMLEHDDVAAWSAEHVRAEMGETFTLATAFDMFKLTGVQLGKIQFSNRIKKLFPGAFQAKYKNVNSVFIDLALLE